MDLGLAGRVAIVTGAGQGVGREIARVLAAEGAAVGVNDYYAERAQAVATEIETAGGAALAIVGDVTDRERVTAMVAETAAAFGDVDILVNNAGVPLVVRNREIKRTAFVDIAAADYKRDIELSLFGAVYCIRAVLDSMIANRRGTIVSIISEAGRVGEPYLSLYSGAKAGVLGFSKALAREVGKYKITVNCIALANIAHEGIKDVFDPDATPETDEKLAKMLKLYPVGRGLGRIGRPSDAAYASAFLASPRAEFITGQCLGVNGGYAMLG